MQDRRDPFETYDEERDDFEDEFADENFSERDEFGCLFPGECCMPNPYHFPSECHTAEMMEELYADVLAAEGPHDDDDNVADEKEGPF